MQNNIKVGILGGGQLGKMLGQAASDWHLHIKAMDKSIKSPAYGYVSEFTVGDILDYNDVINFARDCDILTIEIENVNVSALKQLEKEGIIVHPSPAALDIITDKGIQKQFYKSHSLPTSKFQLVENLQELKVKIESKSIEIPFVAKLRTGGYDGKGVFVINNEEDLENLLDAPLVIEEKVKIQKELAVIACRNSKGDLKTFPAVEMVFNPKENLVDYLLSPALINQELINQAEELARQTIKAFDICGLLAIEMFLTEDNQLLINEVAPRPHNSGHHSVKGNHTSQFQQHLRGILNLPLGDTGVVERSLMLNILGEPGYSGEAKYEGLEEILAIVGVHVYIYGKEETKPARKMGHITITGDQVEELIEKMEIVKKKFRVIA